MMGLNFAAVDFETANGRRASDCQVGLAVVRDGEVVATDSWYVVPPTGIDSFASMNIAIHGITPAMVGRSGLDWASSLGRFEGVVGELPLIAHNSPFDRSVFEHSTALVGLDVPAHRWEDTVALSRRHLPLPNHKLPTVAAHLGFDAFTHHEALADALACAHIATSIARRSGLGSVDHLWPRARKA